MADLSDNEKEIRALLLQTKPEALALSDKLIDDLIQGKRPTADSSDPSLKLDAALIPEIIKWIGVLGTVISIIKGTIDIRAALAASQKEALVTQISDQVVASLHDRQKIEEAVRYELERRQKADR